jgi:hypothetical protein
MSAGGAFLPRNRSRNDCTSQIATLFHRKEKSCADPLHRELAQTTTATQVDIYGASAGSYQVAVCAFSAGGTITYKAGGSFASTGLTYSAGTWYNIRVAVNRGRENILTLCEQHDYTGGFECSVCLT